MKKVLKKLDIASLANYLRSHSEKKFTLTFHSMGDRDAVSSAIALSKYLKNSTVITPDFITRHATQMLKDAGYTGEISSQPLYNCDILIILDSNNLGALGRMENMASSFNGDILFIDHHFLAAGAQDIKPKGFIFSSEAYNSTASIIYDLLKELKYNIDKQSARLLISGISADSADFQNVTSTTFRQISELLEICKANYNEVISYVHDEIPTESRYGLIKDLFGSEIEMVGDYILVYGRCKMHASLVADYAIKLGADASLFWVIEKDEISSSARLRSPLDIKLKIHLGQIMENNAKYIDGNGGGHPGAAGAYGPGKNKTDYFVGKVLEEIRNKLKC